MVPSPGLEAHLGAKQKGVFGPAVVTSCSAAREAGVVVVEDVFDVAGQVPVEADAPGLRLPRRPGGIRIARAEDQRIQLQLAVAGRQLEGSPAALPSIP